MKAAAISEIKKQLTTLPANELADLCIRLAKFKKENKELLHYLLFESHDEPAFIELVKEEIAGLFTEVSRTNLFLAKKTLRKILRITNKYIRHVGTKEAEVELLLFYCDKMRHGGLNWQTSTVLKNIYQAQLKKIEKAIAAMHEDLQYDYLKRLRRFTE